MATDELFPPLRAVKRCKWCHKVKPLTEFHFRPERGRYRAECKDCYREATTSRRDPLDNRRRVKAWQKANPERRRAQSKRSYENSRLDLRRWIANILKSTRASCKERDIQCTITTDKVMELYDAQGGKCALAGRELLFGSKGQQRDSLSIDRIEPGEPYTPENIRLVTYQANMARGMFSDEELFAFCEAVLTTRSEKFCLTNTPTPP